MLPVVLLVSLGVLGYVTWSVANEGVWAAATQFLCVLFGGLIAMNYFEPLANALEGISPEVGPYADVVSLLGLFAGVTFGLRAIAEKLAPVYIGTYGVIDTVGRWVFGFATGYATMAILLTALHTAPLPRQFYDFAPEKPTLVQISPDRQWLGFTQYVSEHSLSWYLSGVPGSTAPVPQGFDSMFHVHKSGSQQYPNQFWSSFPIRYAYRRELLERGGSSRPAAAAPAPVAVPAGGKVDF